MVSEHMSLLQDHIDSLKDLGVDIEDEAQLERIRSCSSMAGLPPLYSQVIHHMGHPCYDIRVTANDFCDDVDVVIRCNAELQRMRLQALPDLAPPASGS
ncbi:hypothetical protein GUITHDRAFT_118141 [Guillardia theta CCMP2712]|uniref:Uncharacterized protein n=1 Tax=Guillardia theta (strain CCMP2712) TaxID=905079 RepID=L1II82_GUITC|nr:hypothetical protein GUITHDRAFT_118141 [Guillardia theta CCMP2712]EKX35654.1 hypothetical protein GUITHDRAFT_118141 [Guillardia theta CCMP2712]|eukprot:XP_005822634.1 hypothetical protein GUITHDRAFT_118141 [Guillardia theta CCMP2712]